MKKIKSSKKGSSHVMGEFQNIIEAIKALRYSQLSEQELKRKSFELRDKAFHGKSLEDLLPEAYALVVEAAYRSIGLRPFDVQVAAAIAMHQGKIAEMQTGEGKTLMAVMPAYLNALAGKGVHVLTFNDYLAKRDAEWMGPIYNFLGLSVGYIKESMGVQERQGAYRADITYVTAKEAGFDYLRDFLCMDKNDLVHKPLNYAIIDEADSILIDEARIPLVIAGIRNQEISNYGNLSSLVKKLKAEEDFVIEQSLGTISFTDGGLQKLENILGCELYSQSRLELLTRLNCAMQAEFLLKRDKDYIVRKDRIEIIDEFTGRIADKRHWPDKLHAAVEAKENVDFSAKGEIMGSIALQHFLSLYPKISGMTGTARTASKELASYYNLETVVIPTNMPCKRKDHEDYIFPDKEIKHEAIVAEVARVYSTGQPILIGTGSVEESEQLASLLREADIYCRVLNAKNDEEEAAVIARAGEYGAVTVSTNMAGRGVDIKLGGVDGKDHDRVAALGGLYIIGTNRHESRRVDDQLRGRAGRQGDPGESRFFISLKDDWIKKYEIIKTLPPYYASIMTSELKDDQAVRTAITRAQRMVEGYNSDLRVQQWKYSFILEQQRRTIHNWRQGLLMELLSPSFLEKRLPEYWLQLEKLYGIEMLQRIERQLTLYFINKHWTDYLDYISYERDSIHLVVIGGQNPLQEFNRRAVIAFQELLRDIEHSIEEAFIKAKITEKGIDMESEGLKSPTATWTYLVNENPDQFSNIPELLRAVSNAIKGPLFTIRSLYLAMMRYIKLYKFPK